jgi:hypothetical protein
MKTNAAADNTTHCKIISVLDSTRPTNEMKPPSFFIFKNKSVNKPSASRHCLRHSLLILAACSGVFFTGNPLRATTFAWPTSPGWTAGAPASGSSVSQTFTSTVDLTVTLTNSGETWATTADGIAANAPSISNSPNSGGTGGNGLQLVTHSQTSNSSYVQVTVAFAAPVTSVSFQIWDVDSNPTAFTDQIHNIQAQPWSTGGPIAATITGSSANSVTGSGTLGALVTGTANSANSATGNVTIKFTGSITSFSFQWSNIASGHGLQGIAFGPISYTAVLPEVGSTIGALGVCALAVGFREIRRRRQSAAA